MSENTTPNPSPQPTPIDDAVARRAALRQKHTQGLAKLMGERSDLRGVHALADFVDESLRWTA